MTDEERTSREVREGVRSGILDSIERDVEQRGGRTARLLLAAGVIGAIGAIGATLLVYEHPYEHHPHWHVTAVSTVWAGLLFVSFAIALLQVRTPALPLAHSASVGILGLGLAGICGALCPDQQFLRWWSATGVGLVLTETMGLALSAVCFGFVTTLVFGVAAAMVVLGDRARATRPPVPAAFLVMLLAPGVLLQSFDTSPGIFVGWLLGTAAGAYAGVAGGILARGRLTGGDA